MAKECRVSCHEDCGHIQLDKTRWMALDCVERIVLARIQWQPRATSGEGVRNTCERRALSPTTATGTSSRLEPRRAVQYTTLASSPRSRVTTVDPRVGFPGDGDRSCGSRCDVLR